MNDIHAAFLDNLQRLVERQRAGLEISFSRTVMPANVHVIMKSPLCQYRPPTMRFIATHLAFLNLIMYFTPVTLLFPPSLPPSLPPSYIPLLPLPPIPPFFLPSSVPMVSFEFYKPSFFSKFLESHLVMAEVCGREGRGGREGGREGRREGGTCRYCGVVTGKHAEEVSVWQCSMNSKFSGSIEW